TGVPGAVVAGFIALAIFLGFLLNEAFRPAIVGIAIVYVVGLVLFAVFGRHRLVLSPEEEYALSGGEHGDPQAEGYDAMEKEVFKKEPLRRKGRAWQDARPFLLGRYCSSCPPSRSPTASASTTPRPDRRPAGP